MSSPKAVEIGAVISVGLFAASLSLPALAAVIEPNGLQVPRPVPAVEVNLAANFNPPSVVALPAVFQVRGENVDWQNDAMTTPAVFSPTCAFTGELVVHGGACHIDFGWYTSIPRAPSRQPTRRSIR